MKTCATCKETKEESNFNKDSYDKHGLHRRCKSCTNIYRRKYYKNKQRKQKYNVKPYVNPGHKICSNCQEDKDHSFFGNDSRRKDKKQRVCRACQKTYNKKLYSKDRFRKYYLASKYNLSTEQYYAKLEAQDNRCAICKNKHSGPRFMAVDHCHSSGKTRDLLCYLCNSVLGLSREKISTLQSAIEYLEKHK